MTSSMPSTRPSPVSPACTARSGRISVIRPKPTSACRCATSWCMSASMPGCARRQGCLTKLGPTKLGPTKLGPTKLGPTKQGPHHPQDGRRHPAPRQAPQDPAWREGEAWSRGIHAPTASNSAPPAASLNGTLVRAEPPAAGTPHGASRGAEDPGSAHGSACWLAGLLRFGVPIDQGFHFDCQDPEGRPSVPNSRRVTANGVFPSKGPRMSTSIGRRHPQQPHGA